MIPASLALVTLNPARQAALRAVAEVELRRENRRRLPEDNPHARAFMRLLTGESRLSSRTAQAIPGLGWDPHFKIWSLRRLEEALEVLLVSRGEHCHSPLPATVQECLFPDVVFRNASRKDQRGKLHLHKTIRRETKSLCREEILHQSLVAQARTDLNFRSPENVGVWYTRWAYELREYELAALFWQWRRRFVSLTELEWHRHEPLWSVLNVLRDVVSGMSASEKAADRWQGPDKLGHSVY